MCLSIYLSNYLSRYVPVPETSQSSDYSSWYKTTYPDKVYFFRYIGLEGKTYFFYWILVCNSVTGTLEEVS